MTLGKAFYIAEDMGHLPIPMLREMAVAAAMPPGFEPTPIMPGEQEIIINVQVAFAIE